MMMMKSLAEVLSYKSTPELLLVLDDVGVIELLHYADLLVYVFLQEWLLLYLRLTDELYGQQLILF